MLDTRKVTLEQMATPEEFAKVLNVHYCTVYRMCRNKKLAAVKVGQQWRIDVTKSLAMLGL